MKKLILLGMCLMVLAGGAFAMDKAFGFGIMYNNTSSFATDSYTESYYGYSYTVTVEEEMRRNGFGAFGFVSLGKMWELNLGFIYKNPYEYIIRFSDSEGDSETLTINKSELDQEIDGTLALQIGVYFKYPIPVSHNIVLFPTAGIDYEKSLSDDVSKDANWSFRWWDDLWLRFGAGVDFFINDAMFVRGHLIYGFALPLGEGADEMYIDYGRGVLLKVGLGWMF